MNSNEQQLTIQHRDALREIAYLRYCIALALTTENPNLRNTYLSNALKGEPDDREGMDH